MKYNKRYVYPKVNKIALLVLGFILGYILGLDPAPAISPAAPVTVSDFFVATVTAYCPCEKCCGDSADGITACGHRIGPGEKFCAADRRYAFGTMIDIPGYGRVPILDRGGAIKGNCIDVFFPNHVQALRWGRQKLTVKIG